MPELPEVTTIVRELNRRVRGKVIRHVVVEAPKLIRPLSPAAFSAAVRGNSFLGVRRRGKFILAELGSKKQETRKGELSSPSLVLLWHMGMTGHPLYRDEQRETSNEKLRTAFADPMNRHVRVTFQFTDGTRLEYADVRKFGKFELIRPADLSHHPQYRTLGPDALEISKHPVEFCARLQARRTGVKVALMDQTVLAGVGNIYADEALWTARIHPLLPTQSLSAGQCRTLTRALLTVLRMAIRHHGTSVDDFRRLSGQRGTYGDLRKVYQRTERPCLRCGTLIMRLVVAGRGTHVCPRCQPRSRS